MGKKCFTLFLALVLLFIYPLEVNAAEILENDSEIQILDRSIVGNNVTRSGEPFLYDCELGIGIAKNGLGVDYTTLCSAIATEIGVKDLVIQEKTATGWRDIPVRDHYTYEDSIYAGSLVYLKAVPGTAYRVFCTHYAIVDGIEFTLENYTDSIVYN